MRVINSRCVLAVRVPELEVDEGALWYVTHGLGTPAGGTYTEVAFARHTPLATGIPPAEQSREVLEQVVRSSIRELYGNRWAFHYPPEEYGEAIGRWQLSLRERLVVTHIEWWESKPDDEREPYVAQLDAPLWRGTDLPDPTREDHP